MLFILSLLFISISLARINLSSIVSIFLVVCLTHGEEYLTSLNRLTFTIIYVVYRKQCQSVDKLVGSVLLHDFNGPASQKFALTLSVLQSAFMHTLHRTSASPPPSPSHFRVCLDRPAALPWPHGSSTDYCLYFFVQKHNASQRPNSPWRAKIIVYNRPSTCNDKSAVMYFRV